MWLLRHLSVPLLPSAPACFIPAQMLTDRKGKHCSRNKTAAPDESIMEGAFTHVGNHLISDSAAVINAGADDLSGLDADENLLYAKYGEPSGRRRADDDDNQTEAFDEEDNDSLNSAPVDGMTGLKLKNAEEKKQLPPHACA